MVERLGEAAGPEALVSLIDVLPMALVGLDRNDQVTHWNPAAERIFGWTATEVMGRPYPVVPERYHEEHRMLLQDAFQGGRGFAGIETQRQRKDGSLVDVAVWSAPLPCTDGPPRAAIAIIVDLTERRKLEHQLYQAQKMEAVGRLAGGIAHDFNNLITVVTGQSSLLLEEDGLTPDMRAGVAEIADAAERASLLTRQLLAFSRRQVLEPRVISINGAIRELGQLLQRLIGDDVEIVTELDAPISHARLDPVQFQQVIMNLAVNARDAMPDGGRLRIATSNATIGVEMASRLPHPVRTGDYVLLEVTDTGVGIDRSIQSRIFEPFFTTKPYGQGTGLGLSTVYGIVKQSCGYIWVDSERGHGCTFRVYLPKVEAERQDAEPAMLGGPCHAGNGARTVLLAEDEVAVRWLARQVLEQAGHRVLEATDGDEAVCLARSYDGPIDLLVSDVVMPGQSGPDLFDRLHADRPEMRALFMSGYSLDTFEPGRLTARGAGFLAKPFTPASLEEAATRLLANGSGAHTGTRSAAADQEALEAELFRLETDTRAGYESAAFTRAGELCLQAGHRERALSYFGRAIDASLLAGLEEEAELACRRILEVAPSVVRARRTLALLAMGRGDVHGAVVRIGEYVRAAVDARQPELAVRQLMTMASISREPELREFLMRQMVQLGCGDADVPGDPLLVPVMAANDEFGHRDRILLAALAPPAALLH